MNRNRLALYVFWEKDGEVRDYVTYYLKGLQEVARTVVLIANGGVNAAGLEKLETMGVEVLQRENHGLDFAAWKDALLQRGWDNVQTYDELILCNCSCYGPVYPFSEAFERMSQKKCDFWGMTYHDEVKEVRLIHNDPSAVVYEHLQSSFLVFRKSVLSNQGFINWWFNMKSAKSYAEEVAYHECLFTKYLQEQCGLSWLSYAAPQKYKMIAPKFHLGQFCADLILEDGVPLAMRDIREEELPKPKYLVACGEFPREQQMDTYFYAGVLVMNVCNMRQRCWQIF